MGMNDLFASLYEAGGTLVIGRNGSFSFNLFQQELYAFLGSWVWISVALVLGIFYFAINHPRFNRWYHWLLTGAVVAMGNAIAGYFITYNTLSFIPGLDFTFEYFQFAMVNFAFALLSFAALTFILRLFRVTKLSRNCSTCPIPN